MNFLVCLSVWYLFAFVAVASFPSRRIDDSDRFAVASIKTMALVFSPIVLPILALYVLAYYALTSKLK